jgi:hypothetical protein
MKMLGNGTSSIDNGCFCRPWLLKRQITGLLSSKPVPREIAERTITTSMLAFSETWIRA